MRVPFVNQQSLLVSYCQLNLLFEGACLEFNWRIVAVEIKTAFTNGNALRLFHQLLKLFQGLVILLIPIVFHEVRMNTDSCIEDVWPCLGHNDSILATDKLQTGDDHLLDTSTESTGNNVICVVLELCIGEIDTAVH